MRWLALACLLLLPHQAAAAKDFIALTVSNEFRDGNIDAMCRLFESAAQNRVPLELICYGASWKGVGTKIQCLNDRLQQSDIDDNTLVLFVDAYDVVSAAGL